MRIEGFRELLEGCGYTQEQIESCVAGVDLFDAYVSEQGGSVEGASADAVPLFASSLIERGLNQRPHFVGLYHYAGMIRDYELQVAVLQLLDGFEIPGNLHRFIGEVLGDDVQARIFEGVDLPQLGTTPLDWVRMASVVMPRLEAEADAYWASRR